MLASVNKSMFNTKDIDMTQSQNVPLDGKASLTLTVPAPKASAKK